MLHSIELTNFQSHERSLLEFSSGVNVILGSSDSGKSAIFRALNWVLTNRPSGDSFIRQGTKECSVELRTTDHSDSVIRKKGKINSYQIGPDTLEAFGQSVPAEVREYLNIDDLNVQHQHDSPFLLSLSSGEIAKVLNKAANLEDIDTASSAVQAEYKVASANLSTKNDQVCALDKELLSYAFVDSAESDLLRLESQEVRLQQLQKKYRALCDLFKDVDDITSRIAIYSDRSYLIPDIDSTLERVRGLQDLKVTYKKYTPLVDQVSEITAALRDAEEVLNDMEKAYKENFPDICPLCEQEVVT